MKHKRGEFEIKSGSTMISDPCYSVGTWCQRVLTSVKNGAWSAFVNLASDGCVAQLLAFNGKTDRAPRIKRWEEVPAEIGVDSGQCGIFDTAHYRDDSAIKAVQRLSTEIICADEPWYSICCDRTLETEHRAGIIPYGCVSASGYGDGSYGCYIQRDNEGLIIGIKIEFISETEAM
jgi:hypothetical protein